MRGALVLALVLGGAACGDDAPAERPAQATQPLPAPRGQLEDDVGAQRARQGESVPGRGTVVASDDPRVRPPWVGGGGGGGGPGRFPDRNGRRTMDEDQAQAAASAIAQARMEGDSPCEQAYDALDRFRADFQKNTPWVPSRRPDRGRFMESCLALPRPLQQCMVPSYLRAHEEECSQVGQRWPAMTGPGEGSPLAPEGNEEG